MDARLKSNAVVAYVFCLTQLTDPGTKMSAKKNHHIMIDCPIFFVDHCKVVHHASSFIHFNYSIQMLLLICSGFVVWSCWGYQEKSIYVETAE